MRNMNTLRVFILGVERFSERVGRGSSYMVVAIIGVALFEVIARFCFNDPTVWGYETTEILFGLYALLAGGFCLLHERHIRADVLWGRWSLKRKAIADLAVSGLSFLFIGGLFLLSIPFAWHSFQVGETSPTVWAPPIYPFKFIMIVAVAFLLLQLIAKFLRDIATVRGILLVPPSKGSHK